MEQGVAISFNSLTGPAVRDAMQALFSISEQDAELVCCSLLIALNENEAPEGGWRKPRLIKLMVAAFIAGGMLVQDVALEEE